MPTRTDATLLADATRLARDAALEVYRQMKAGRPDRAEAIIGELEAKVKAWEAVVRKGKR